jgi:hypothetical protein
MLQEQENVTESRLTTFQHQTETRLVVSATQGTAPSINQLLCVETPGTGFWIPKLIL